MTGSYDLSCGIDISMDGFAMEVDLIVMPSKYPEHENVVFGLITFHT